MSKAHKGGAWKVAYADFVTSMMALFLVLWILASSEEMRKGIADYFKATALLQKNFSEESKKKIISALTSKKVDEVVQAAGSLQSILQRNNNEMTDRDEIRFEFLNDGLRIQAMDRSSRPLFEAGGSELTDYGRWMLGVIAWEIERYNFHVEVEGHTQGGDLTVEQSQNMWDLSTRRALSAQSCLEENGIRPKQFWRVAGYADRQPLDGAKPEQELNRRITVTLRLDPNSDIDAARKSFPTP